MGNKPRMTEEEGFDKLIETWSNVATLMKRFDKIESHMADRFDKMDSNAAEMSKYISQLPCAVHRKQIEHMEEKFQQQGKLPCELHDQKFQAQEKSNDNTKSWTRLIFGGLSLKILWDALPKITG